MRYVTLISLLVLGLADGTDAADRFVSHSTGSDTVNDCLSSSTPCKTIGRALAVMADGDTVKIAKGLYKESLEIHTAGTRTFQGGWPTDFSAQDPAHNKTTWKGDPVNHRALAINAFGISISTILDALDMSGSRFPTGTFESGGAIQGFSGDTVAPSAVGSLTLILNEVSMKMNRADTSGGAISLQQNDSSTMTLTITGSEFTNNTGEFTAGAIELLCTNTPGTMNVDISDTEFTGNDSTDKNFHAGGGAISFVSTCTSARLTLTANRFHQNTANGKLGGGTSGGGAIRVEPNGSGSPTVTLINDVFDGNKSQGNGGAIAVFGTSPGSVTLHSRNSTFFHANHAKSSGGGVWLSGTVTADLVNDIIWGSTIVGPGAGRDLATDSVPVVTLTHTNIGSINGSTTDGGGNISVNPLFNIGTFTLKPTSPMIDAGTCIAPSGPPVPTVDFFGNKRPAGTTCDIGAVEFQ